MEAILDHLTVAVLLVFLAITFLQSGLDKLLDFQGNLSWLKGHFSKTPFRNAVPLLLAVLLIVETATGVLSIAGLIEIFLSGESRLALLAAVLANAALLMLLFGQRIAKDYDGARTIVIYLMPSIFLLYLLQG